MTKLPTMRKFRAIAIVGCSVAGIVLICAYIINENRLRYERVKDKEIGIQYQLAYENRLDAICRSLERFHAQMARYPNSMEEWAGFDPQAARFEDPLPNEAKRLKILLENLSMAERTLIVHEPGVMLPYSERISYIGIGLDNTPPYLCDYP